MKITNFADGVILGVKPNFPSTEYGYIKVGEKLSGGDDFYHIQGFEEKPDKEKALRFCADGDYLWNTGITLWKVKSLLRLMEKHVPQHHTALREVAKYMDTPGWESVTERKFQDLERVSVDRAIFEKAKNWPWQLLY